jgi:type IV secretion system protein VirD4
VSSLAAHVVPVAVGAALWAAVSSRDLLRLAQGRRRARRSGRWATRRELSSLRVRSGATPAGRLLLGTATALAGPAAIATEPGQSVIVIGPTQSGKTTSLAVPAILAWPGPVVAASVKSDLLRDTLATRRGMGRVWCIDPAGSTGGPADTWSPLDGCADWSHACRVAADLCHGAKAEGITADGDFWYSTAAKLLAPLLLAAAADRRAMADVVRWVDTQEMSEVAEVLERVGPREALDAACATWQRDERTRSSVYTTAETVLAPFAQDRPSSASLRFEPAQLLGGSHTVYLCAPAHDQRRLRGYFTALIQQVVTFAFGRATNSGRALSPPLLVVLDETAHIAPLADLDGLAATCASHGIQIITIWQDVAQVRARYGARAATVLNNHRAKLFMPGIADPDTLDYASRLVGDEEVTLPTVTREHNGRRSTTSTPSPRRLLPPDELRCLPRGQAVLVYGTLPPARLRLRPWWQTNVSSAQSGGRGGPMC